jgi:hypothetical protein
LTCSEKDAFSQVASRKVTERPATTVSKEQPGRKAFSQAVGYSLAMVAGLEQVHCALFFAIVTLHHCNEIDYYGNTIL